MLVVEKAAYRFMGSTWKRRMGPFGDSFRLRAEIQHERIHFVQNDLALAFTFLDFAKATRQAATRERNIENARKACGEVAFWLAGNFDCTDEERANLEGALARLKKRLNEEIYA